MIVLEPLRIRDFANIIDLQLERLTCYSSSHVDASKSLEFRSNSSFRFVLHKCELASMSLLVCCVAVLEHSVWFTALLVIVTRTLARAVTVLSSLISF